MSLKYIKSLLILPKYFQMEKQHLIPFMKS